MDLWDATGLILIIATPTLVGVLALTAPRWCGVIADRWRAARPEPPAPLGPPIERLAADLRRLLRLHGELTASAHAATRARRLWAVEAAIGARAVEAARALEVPYRELEPLAVLPRRELRDLLRALAEAGLVLPTGVGPFLPDGRM